LLVSQVSECQSQVRGSGRSIWHARIRTGKRSGALWWWDACGGEPMQGNALIRLVGYVLAQGSLIRQL